VMVEDKLLTTADVAERLQVNEQTVRRWIRDGDLRAVRLGGNKSGYRVLAADLGRFLADRWTVPPPEG